MKSRPGDSVWLRAPGGSEQLQILEVRYEGIPMEPFSEPAGAQAALESPQVASRGRPSQG
jgi:transcription elongation factor GreB